MTAIRKLIPVCFDETTVIDPRIARYYRVAKALGWSFHVTTQNRGYCRYRDKVITIPLWVIARKDKNYFTWYLSHELAHTHVGWKAHHGEEFQKELQRICPADCIKYEMTYKGTNATKAGIHSVMEMTLEELL